MKILHINKGYTLLGGVEKYVREAVEYQRNEGHIVDVLAVSTNKQKLIYETDKGVTYEYPLWFEFASGRFSLSFTKSLMFNKQNYDIIHFHSPDPGGELSGLIAYLTKRLSSPIVVTFHNEVSRNKPFFRTYRFFQRFLFKKAIKLIVTSPNLSKCETLRGFENKSVVIPLGIYLSNDALDEKEIGERIKSNKKRIIFCGRLSPVKGLDWLIEAMCYVDAQLDIVGDGPEAENLKQMSKQYNVNNRIIFHGFVEDEELKEMYKKADIAILPSIHQGEGFGYVLLEAAMYGTALISTEIGTGTSYVNLDSETGYVVPPKDSKVLANAINSMFNDYDKLFDMKRRARQRAIDEFEFNKVQSSIIEIYKDVLDEHRSKQ